MSFPAAQLSPSLAHQGSTTSLTAQVSSVPAYPVTTSSGPTPGSGLLSVPPQNYGTATAPSSVAGSALSLHNPSNGSISSNSQGHAQAAEAKRNAIHAAWTEAGGEIPVVDKDRDPWTVIFDGALAIKDSPKGKSWKDGYGVLLDTHLLLFEKETTPTGTTKYSHMIKPIPLECLRSSSFSDDAEDRKQDISLFNKIGRASTRPRRRRCIRSPYITSPPE
ncbi:hypothetical protein BC827DRAFT_365526 [Russula dissimulans]|nr:hypothetical protein BC827DRAFT_365526 [Russula dissimulans]